MCRRSASLYLLNVIKHFYREGWHGVCSCPIAMSAQFRTSVLLRTTTPVVLTLILIACGNDRITKPGGKDDPKIGETSFISAPSNRGRSWDDGAEASGDDALGAPGLDNGGEPPAEEPGRAIAEADIIKVDGTKLYALSRYSGLAIIDVSDPAHLKLLGRHKSTATPFEMYVEGERVYVMYNEFGHYERGEDGWNYRTQSRIEALDVSDPSAIRLIGGNDLAGRLSDSRKVGDVLYLVTFEDGACWQCDINMNTRVASFNVKDPDEFALIDQVRFVDEGGYYGQRSIAVTEERIYVSGQDWGGRDTGVVDVVDISDPGGDLVVGASFALAGPVQNRWQMDEHEGIFRAITQPGSWGTTTPPVVETFEVVSSGEIKPVGSLTVTLPRPESLRSVRFDGKRAFAITFERTDPLFTFDLSEPAAPRQLGELEIPGWVYHMEPRGDRIYALGFDDAENGGALHVSLFDVSELSDPKQLARVNFGGAWANFAEDQDRIHKAFNIMADEGLILVPFAGWDYSEQEDQCSWGKYESGIQLVDMSEDTLSLRGVAPQVGEARRGLLVNGALFGVSDNAVQTFDIADRDAPKPLGNLELARNISSIRVMGDSMLRFGSDWWTERTTLDFVALGAVDVAEPLGDLDLSAVAPLANTCERQAYFEGNVFVHGDYAYVPQRIYSTGASGESAQYLRFYVADLRDRTAPRIVGAFSVRSESENEQLLGVTLTDQALLVGRSVASYVVGTDGKETYTRTLSYDVFSLEDPAKPALASKIDLPATLFEGGFGYNVTGCMVDVGYGWWGRYSVGGQVLVSGDIIASQHQVPLNDGTDRVRYYLDRIDVGDPANPKILSAVNVPGGVVDFDARSGRVVTVDTESQTEPVARNEDCEGGSFDGQNCVRYLRSLNTLVVADDVAELLDRVMLDGDGYSAGDVAVGDDRVFVVVWPHAGTTETQVRTYAIEDGGSLADLGFVPTEAPGWGSLVARGTRAFLSSYGRLTAVDAGNLSEVKTENFDLGGYYCNAIEVTSTHAYCAMGYEGVAQFKLGD